MSQFARYIGIDYSGAETANSSCKGSGTPEQVLFLLLFENDVPVWNPKRMRNQGEYFVFDKRR